MILFTKLSLRCPPLTACNSQWCSYLKWSSKLMPRYHTKVITNFHKKWVKPVILWPFLLFTILHRSSTILSIHNNFILIESYYLSILYRTLNDSQQFSFDFQQALILASVFEMIGAIALGARVADTVRSGLFDPELYNGHEELLMVGQLSALTCKCLG